MVVVLQEAKSIMEFCWLYCWVWKFDNGIVMASIETIYRYKPSMHFLYAWMLLLKNSRKIL